jgi:hypothetical protein
MTATAPIAGPTLARTIDDVIDLLDTIVNRAITHNDRVGYFAALYKTMTAAMRDAIRAGEFLDGARMERLDVAFANRYFEALWAYENGRPVTASWRVAFDACKRREPTILQHLYLGLAAHQLLDLGIAAAEVSPGARIYDLRGDFDYVNELVGRLMRTVDARVGEASPWIGLLDRVAPVPYAIANRVGIYFAREQAWTFALELAHLDDVQQNGRIARRDVLTARLERWIEKPPAPISLLARGIRMRESDDVAKNIRILWR